MKSIPPKVKAAINGQIVEYVIAGSGSQSIVLVNGAGGPIEGWHRAFESIASMGTVFAYNRLGVGGSSKPVAPQTGDTMVDVLRALLRHANVPPPHILVGHSLGGLIVNLFARSFPAEVSGVVLLEATAPEDVQVMAEHQTDFQRLVQRAVDALRRKNELAETEHLSHTVDLIDQAGPFPPVPVIVVTGGKPAMQWAILASALAARAKNQLGLIALSPKGKQIIAKQSGHFPQFTEPGVIVDTVREAMFLAARE